MPAKQFDFFSVNLDHKCRTSLFLDLIANEHVTEEARRIGDELAASVFNSATSGIAGGLR